MSDSGDIKYVFGVIALAVALLALGVGAVLPQAADMLLSDLGDVSIGSPQNGDVLVYNATLGRWVDGNDVMLHAPLSIGGSTGNATFESDGTLVFGGNGTVWETSAIPISGLGKGAASPDYYYVNGTFQALAFDGQGTAETVYGTSPITSDYKMGSYRYPHLLCCATTNDAGNVTWTLTTAICNGTHLSTPSVDKVTVAMAGKEHAIMANFSAIAGGTTKPGDVVLFTLSRDPTESTDTYEHDAAILVIGAWYEVDSLGARTMWAK